MGFWDFWFGFLKPIRDHISAIAAYAILTSQKTLISSVNNSEISFNLTVILIIFCVISFFQEFILSGYQNFKSGYKEPIDSAFRMFGVFCGVITWSVILIPIYCSIGGNIEDLITSEIIAGFFVIGGMLFRLYVLPHPNYY